MTISSARFPRLDHAQIGHARLRVTCLAAARRHGVVAGSYCASPDYAARMVSKGVQFVNALSDRRLMAAASRTTIAASHDGVGRETQSKSK